jgi:arabinofuranosyltransferase
MIAGAMKLGISPIAAAHFIGIASYLCAGALLILILGGLTVGSAVACSLYFTAPFFFTHAWSGLETMLFTAAILFAVYAFRRRRDGIFLAALLLLSSVRPEGFLFAFILMALYQPLSRRLVLAFVVPCAVYFAWRWTYYGRMLPNTFYAKSVSSPSDREANGAYLFSFFKTYLLWPTLCGLVFARLLDIKKHWRIVAATAAFSAIVLFSYVRFKLEMNFIFRFYAPFYPLALVGVGGALNSGRRVTRLWPVVLVLTAFQVGINAKELRTQMYSRASYWLMLNDEHIALGKYLRDVAPQNERLIVHADAGAIPYYSKLKTVDFGRLNDEYLAAPHRTPQEINDYFYSVNAGVVVITSLRRDVLTANAEVRHIVEDPRFRSYVLVEGFGSERSPNYTEFIFVRRDLRQRWHGR